MKNNVQLITYVDRLSGGNLNDMLNLLNSDFKDLFSGVHILPFFYPIDGEDAGFDPIDHTMIDSRLGDWNDLAEYTKDYDVMADMIVNHISAESPLFQDYLKKEKDSEYADLFLRMENVFPKGATEEDFLAIYRPRPGLPFSVYNFENGVKGLFWTTFTKNQIDINVDHEKGWSYLINILDVFQKAGIKCIRLDATGYAIKKPGTSCFMLPETYDFIDKLKGEANSRKIEVLVEIHSHYQTQIEISRHSDYVYDFALPPLVLHALIRGTGQYLETWLKQSPRNAITVLDTHDGIGIIDAGPSAQGKADGLLNEEEINFLVNSIHENSNGTSLQATGTAASNVDLYQVNCTFYEALGCDDNLYLLARLIQFFAPGIPQVYYVGFLSGKNDMKLLEKTGVGRDINRHYFERHELESAILREEARQFHSLIKFRNTHPAFNGDFSILESGDKALKLKYIKGEDFVSLDINLATKEFKIESSIEGKLKTYTTWGDFI